MTFLSGFPKEALSACIDYIRITFKTHDVDRVIEEVMGLKKRIYAECAYSKIRLCRKI
ncbi:hypothetical protein [Listeria floridensis]|uniref:hypothetical protein n=1 Tax=Listeria floridensis TaxID=1494962 RepID=UPI00138AC914